MVTVKKTPKIDNHQESFSWIFRFKNRKEPSQHLHWMSTKCSHFSIMIVKTKRGENLPQDCIYSPKGLE